MRTATGIQFLYRQKSEYLPKTTRKQDKISPLRTPTNIKSMAAKYPKCKGTETRICSKQHLEQHR